MKYWTELTNLETQIIRLETMRSLFSLIASGAEQSSEEDIRNALWYVEGSLNDIHNEMRNEFEELWDIVKNDYSEELVERVKHKGGMKKKKMMTDKELP